MLEKNKKKEENKKMRNLWGMRPVTQIVPNKKAYNRKRQKDNDNKFKE